MYDSLLRLTIENVKDTIELDSEIFKFIETDEVKNMMTIGIFKQAIQLLKVVKGIFNKQRDSKFIKLYADFEGVEISFEDANVVVNGNEDKEEELKRPTDLRQRRVKKMEEE